MRWPYLSLVLLIGALWLTTRRYPGVVGDAILYTVQALNLVLPGRFGDDLYFKFGSQDQFTVFSFLYGPVLSSLGISRASLILTVLAQCAWLAGLFYFVMALTRSRWQTLVSLAVVVALPNAYGPFGIFGFGESYLTPRLISEALTMAALGMLLRGLGMRALLTLALSAGFHPLVTLPGLGVYFLYKALERPVWWAGGGAAATLAVALALAGVQPFARLGTTMDPAWLEIVRVRDSLCLLAEWKFADYTIVAAVLALAVLGLVLAAASERRILAVVTAVGIGGLVCSFVGGDLAHNALVIDAQLWRAMWLLTLVAHVVVVPIVLRLSARAGEPLLCGRLLLAGLGMLVVAGAVPVFHFYAALTLLLACILAVVEVMWRRPLSRAVRLCAYLAVAIMLGEGALFAGRQFEVLREFRPETFRSLLVSLGVISAALAGVAGAALGLAGALPGRGVLQRALPVLAAALLLAAGLRWDHRSAWARFVESDDVPRSLDAALPKEASVYWDGGIDLLWLGLRRPSYFSCLQGTGALFSRGTALAYEHRRESFRPLRTSDFGLSPFCPGPEEGASAPPGGGDLRRACAREPGLDYIVLVRPIPGVPSREWVAPAMLETVRFADGKPQVHRSRRFYIHACAGTAAATAPERSGP